MFFKENSDNICLGKMGTAAQIQKKWKELSLEAHTQDKCHIIWGYYTHKMKILSVLSILSWTTDAAVIKCLCAP